MTGNLTGNVTGEVSTINNHIKAGSDTFKKTSGSSQDFTVSGITSNSIITITLTTGSIYIDSNQSYNIQPVVTISNVNTFTITTYANGVAVQPDSDFNFNYIIFIPQ